MYTYMYMYLRERQREEGGERKREGNKEGELPLRGQQTPCHGAVRQLHAQTGGCSRVCV